MAANWIAPGRSFVPASPNAPVDPSGADGTTVRVAPPTVLVVDDNPDLRDLVSVKLYQAGYDVKTASNGWEALQAAENWLPDLIVLDIMMPGPSGLEVCRKIRANRYLAHVPVIMLSAAFTVASAAEARDAGANLCMGKPFRPRDLLAEVSALLSGSDRAA